jgi:pilus assembly protein CpaB
MNIARIVVLTIAIGAGGVAAYLASGTDKGPPPPAAVQLPTVDVLVAKSDIDLGKTVTADDLKWEPFPEATASSRFIRRSERPKADRQFVGWIARGSFIGGEPIREQKLVEANGSGFMAAVLPSGMRAVSTEISPETGAGGFILPNDRVDVILTKRERSADRPGTPDVIIAEVILPNVRVLAIDQAPKEKDGQSSVIGKTATLELKSEQARILARARQMGTVSLALRSITDASDTVPTPEIAMLVTPVEKPEIATLTPADSTLINIYRGVLEPEHWSCNPICERR